MDFDEVLEAVKSRTFNDEKLQVFESSLSSCHGYLSAEQVAQSQLVKEFPFDDILKNVKGFNLVPSTTEVKLRLEKRE